MNIFRHKLNILVLGKNGMLGSQLFSEFSKLSQCKHSLFNKVDGLDYPEIDLSKKHAVDIFLDGKIHYDWIINCAAITDTKGIQTNAEVNAKSYEVNALACKWIAQACKSFKTKLVHISTDYVFSENCREFSRLDFAGKHGFKVDDDEFPVNDYGMHKLIGEQFIKNELDDKSYAIIRASWLYGSNGNKSFVHKFLKNCWLKSKNMQSLPVKVTMTSNEISAPTSVDNLIKKIYNVIDFNLHGIFNGNDVGMFSKYDPISRNVFAAEILENFKDVFPNVELVPVEAKMPEFGQMRYPADSYMQASMDDFCYGTLSWKVALRDFCQLHRSEILEWLKQF